MKVFKSAALVLLGASAASAFAPASLQTSTTSGVALSMSSDNNCDDRRSFVNKVSLHVTAWLAAISFNPPEFRDAMITIE